MVEVNIFSKFHLSCSHGLGVIMFLNLGEIGNSIYKLDMKAPLITDHPPTSSATLSKEEEKLKEEEKIFIYLDINIYIKNTNKIKINYM